MKTSSRLAAIAAIMIESLLPTQAQTNIFPASGNVGIGTTSPGAILTVQSDATYNGEVGALRLQTATDTYKRLYLGYDKNLNVGYIQAQQAGTNWEPLLLNPNGGNVGIGTTTPTARFDLGTQAPSINTPFSYLRGYSANTNWPISMGSIYDSNYVDQYLILGGYLDGGSKASPTVFGGGAGASFIRDTRTGSTTDGMAFGYVASGSGHPPIEVMRIAKNGNVGIGSTGPSYPLTVIKPGGDGYVAQFGSVSNLGVLVKSVGIDASFNSASDGSLMLYLKYGGNVGINQTNPSFKLDVIGIANSYTVKFKGDTTSGQSYGLLIDAGTTSADTAFLVRDVTGASTRFVVRGDGNVGIGTTNPTYPLTVNGTVRAKEVIVDTGWSDFVFDPGYRLAPLSEVEQHIRDQKHLPGIPTAAEVKSAGISVGEMQAKLLQKIEELTLHQIEEEKRIRRLENENAELWKLLSP